MYKCVFQEEIVAWNYTLEDTTKLAKERRIKLVKDKLELVLICQKTLFAKDCTSEGIRINFRFHMKYCKFMKRNPVDFFEGLAKKILANRFLNYF